MAHEANSNHSSSGFGKNTGGLGIMIVAGVAVVLALMAWNLWNSGSAERNWYRLQSESAATSGHGDGHENGAAGHNSVGHADSTAHTGDSSAAVPADTSKAATAKADSAAKKPSEAKGH